MTNAKFSFYLPPHFLFLDEKGQKHFASMTPTKSVTVQELFDYIKHDEHAALMTDTFRNLPDAAAEVKKYRNEKDASGNWQTVEAGTETKAKQFKNTRFCFVQAAGVFKRRSADDFQTPSGLWCVDFDHFAASAEQIAAAKDALLSDDKAQPVLVFTSPSGDGLKAFYLFDYIEDEAERKARLLGLYRYLREKHADWKERGTDKHALDAYTDTVHCCNVPHDDDARRNLNAFTRLDWNVWRVEPEKHTASVFVASDTDGVKAKWYVDELLRCGIDVTSDMNEQEYLALAHAFTGLTGGEALFQSVSSLWPKYTEANTRSWWKLATRQTSRADVSHFFKIAIEALGGRTWEKDSGTPEADAAVRAFKDEFLNTPAGEKWLEEHRTQNTKRKMTKKDNDTTAEQKTEAAALTEQELFDIVCKQRDFEDILTEAAKIAVSIPTNYVFGTDKEREPLTLKSQALTVIGAGTSHGKTRFLENILLRVADFESEDIRGTTFFFTLEESLSDVLAQLININTGVHEVRHEEFVNNFTAYADAFRRMTYGDDGKRFFSDDTEFAAAKGNILSFRDKYFVTDKVRIIDDERFRDVDTFCAALRAYVNSGQPLKAVFLDHLGMMTTNDKSLSYSAPKTERVEHIVTKLELLSKELNVPFVLTQQLNRTASGFHTLENGNLADSADVERSANTVVLLWNSSVQPNGLTEKELVRSDGSAKASKKLNEHGFFYGIRGALAAKLTKRRGGKRDVWTVFDFDGATGQIKEMTPERVKELAARYEKNFQSVDEATKENLRKYGKNGDFRELESGMFAVLQIDKSGRRIYEFNQQEFNDWKKTEEKRKAIFANIHKNSKELLKGAEEYEKRKTTKNVEALQQWTEQQSSSTPQEDAAAQTFEAPADESADLPF